MYFFTIVDISFSECKPWPSGITLDIAGYLLSYSTRRNQVRFPVGAPNPHHLAGDAQCRSQAQVNAEDCDRWNGSAISLCGSPSGCGDPDWDKGTKDYGFTDPSLGLRMLNIDYIETFDKSWSDKSIFELNVINLRFHRSAVQQDMLTVYNSYNRCLILSLIDIYKTRSRRRVYFRDSKVFGSDYVRSELDIRY